MRVFSNAKTLMTLYKDYRTMNDDDLADFYQSKCDYYFKAGIVVEIVGDQDFNQEYHGRNEGFTWLCYKAHRQKDDVHNDKAFACMYPVI